MGEWMLLRNSAIRLTDLSGIDDNVPVWHSREYISIIKTLNPNANAT